MRAHGRKHLFWVTNERPHDKTSALQHITLICGGEERISIAESLLPRASTVHNNK
mgnify:CR=1 FL=1|jgi:hypothetical protein